MVHYLVRDWLARNILPGKFTQEFNSICRIFRDRISIILCFDRHNGIILMENDIFIRLYGDVGGAWIVSNTNTKRIMISIPQHLLQEVDGVVEKENSNRSELIRQAMKLYLRERKKRHIRETMKKGYMEMASINLNMASEAFLAEAEADHTLDRLVSGV